MSGFKDNGILLAIGAYGRPARLEDWKAGKDFQVWGGPYFSRRDVKALVADGLTHIQFYVGMNPSFVVDLGAESDD